MHSLIIGNVNTLLNSMKSPVLDASHRKFDYRFCNTRTYNRKNLESNSSANTYLTRITVFCGNNDRVLLRSRSLHLHLVFTLLVYMDTCFGSIHILMQIIYRVRTKWQVKYLPMDSFLGWALYVCKCVSRTYEQPLSSLVMYDFVF